MPLANPASPRADKRLTVLQIIPAMRSGGAELGCLQVAEALVEAGHRALVISEGGRMVDDLARVGAEHITASMATKNPWRMRANARLLAGLIRREKIDLLHARSRAPAWSAWAAAGQVGVPFLTTYHSGYSERNALKRLYNSVMVKGARVIAVSDWIADLIASRYGTPRSRIAVIHRVVDTERFDAVRVSEDRKAALRQAWGLSGDAPVILLTGRVTRRKGHDVLARAAARLKDEVPFICICAGDDQAGTSYRAEMDRLIATLGLGDGFRFVGHVDDMPAAYALASVSVSAATAPEGFQRAMLESQAMGVPVAVSDEGPGVEVVRAPPRVREKEATGYNFGSGDAAALARALRALLTMPDAERRAMGRRGRDWVRGTYSRETLTRATLALYQDVVRERGFARSQAE